MFIGPQLYFVFFLLMSSVSRQPWRIPANDRCHSKGSPARMTWMIMIGKRNETMNSWVLITSLMKKIITTSKSAPTLHLLNRGSIMRITSFQLILSPRNYFIYTFYSLHNTFSTIKAHKILYFTPALGIDIRQNNFKEVYNYTPMIAGLQRVNRLVLLLPKRGYWTLQ